MAVSQVDIVLRLVQGVRKYVVATNGVRGALPCSAVGRPFVG